MAVQINGETYYRTAETCKLAEVSRATLVRKLPLPIRKIIGDLSSREQTMIGLDLRPVNLE